MRRRQVFRQQYEQQEAAKSVASVISDPEKFVCECGRVFTNEHGLKVHKSRAHK